MVLFENMYFYCTFLTVTKILSVLIAKISCRKTQKMANPQKFRATLWTVEKNLIKFKLLIKTCADRFPELIMA